MRNARQSQAYRKNKKLKGCGTATQTMAQMSSTLSIQPTKTQWIDVGLILQSYTYDNQSPNFRNLLIRKSENIKIHENKTVIEYMNLIANEASELTSGVIFTLFAIMIQSHWLDGRPYTFLT